ncbi:MAG TPA: NTP transferase domain-containing protein [Anaeromyxobacteraceae bacterium]|nr:NTP transferase domain-containing protein [Anaeromyxobacteraceae bacterium]
MAIAGVLLAAGSATRMGRNKLLLEIDGESLVRRAAKRAIDGGLAPVLVVLGHDAARARRALEGLPCQAVVNEDWASGQSASLSAGVSALPGDATAAVVLLADMPLVDAAMIRAVVARHLETQASLVAARYGTTTAPPILYARSLFPELVGGSGEGRGREVVRRHGGRAQYVDFPEAALADVDFPEDLERARLAFPGKEGSVTDAENVLAQAAGWHEAGLGVAIATVTSTWGSALRPTGSQLAVNEKGAFSGSVSGGCVEAAVIGEALEVIRDGKPRQLRFGVTNEQAWEVGMACGGTIEIYVERLG